jgi:hypothetical protein
MSKVEKMSGAFFERSERAAARRQRAPAPRAISSPSGSRQTRVRPRADRDGVECDRCTGRSSCRKSQSLDLDPVGVRHGTGRGRKPPGGATRCGRPHRTPCRIAISARCPSGVDDIGSLLSADAKPRRRLGHAEPQGLQAIVADREPRVRWLFHRHRAMLLMVVDQVHGAGMPALEAKDDPLVAGDGHHEPVSRSG